MACRMAGVRQGCRAGRDSEVLDPHGATEQGS